MWREIFLRSQGKKQLRENIDHAIIVHLINQELTQAETALWIDITDNIHNSVVFLYRWLQFLNCNNVVITPKLKMIKAASLHFSCILMLSTPIQYWCTIAKVQKLWPFQILLYWNVYCILLLQWQTFAEGKF